MSQHLLHYLGVNASSQHQVRAAMAQIMESDAQSSLLTILPKLWPNVLGSIGFPSIFVKTSS